MCNAAYEFSNLRSNEQAHDKDYTMILECLSAGLGIFAGNPL